VVLWLLNLQLDLVVNNEAVSLVVSRQVVAEVIARLIEDKSPSNHNAVLDIGNRLLALVQPRIISYEEQVFCNPFFNGIPMCSISGSNNSRTHGCYIGSAQ
jgi:hypothetical protein